ncbi:MAG: hypothetical protein MR648_00350 [Clostridiales bacterium]|nr:hypothetical protein [Clostridiales bacterium]MDY4182659.1 hypothetical protein [Pseudoflavonifractor sp.]
MTDKDLRKLRREELLELLIDQSRKNEELQAELTELRARFEERRICLQEAGSIAEASLRLNGVFDAAQAAAEQYLENIREMSGRQESVCAQLEQESRARAERRIAEAEEKCRSMERETEEKCRTLEAEAREEHDRVTAQARQEAESYWQEVSRKLEDFYAAHAGLRELLAMHKPEQMQG